MENIIVFGNSDFTKLTSIYLEQKYNICAYTVNSDFISTTSFLSKPLIDFEKIEKHYPANKYKMFISLGYTKRNTLRERIYNEAKNKGYTCISYIHPTCIISPDVKIGENVFMFERVIVQPFTKLGNNILVQSSASICHDSIINDNVFIGSNACINGFVTICTNSFIGANATIRDHVTIAKKSLIGAGVVINENTEESYVYKALMPDILGK